MNFQKGQSIAEVVLVLGVAAVVVIALIILVLNSLKNAQFSQNQVKATKLAQESIDKIKAIRDRGSNVVFAAISTTPTGCTGTNPVICPFNALWQMKLTADPNCTIIASECHFQVVADGTGYKLNEASIETNIEGGFSRDVLMTDKATNDCTLPLNCDYTNEKRVIVKVSWSDSSGSHESNLQTIITPQ